MKRTWMLIAKGERARCVERHATNHSLAELADFVHPQTNVISKASGGAT